MEEINVVKKNNNSQLQIAGAIIITGVIIAGAILLKNTSPGTINGESTNIVLAKVDADDRTLGSPKAKVTLISYGDFQCPFCGAITGLAPEDADTIKYLKRIDPNWSPLLPGIMDYIKNGDVQFVYRDFTFLGPESIKSAEAARCAGDQAKFWEYHDYLYAHQNGENRGNFSNSYLKSFAKNLSLNTADFNKCLDENKYAQAVADSTNKGKSAGVTGTPKGFILKNGKIVSTIDGAESWTTVKPKIDSALK
ncbi:MAG: DSBA oxidoreductase [Parcubacteria group bacterium GW2011_GWB1_36_5]|nr:MAG: DSBA oxidoreductase [Parcubacteria group bacterium GW2011_GWB1_36_5]